MDEPTGGTHLSLVLAGAYKKSFEEAEILKRQPENHEDVLTTVRPVIEKMGSIISRHTQDYEVKDLFLVGGTSCMPEFETIIEEQTGIATHKPLNPFLVTHSY